VAERERSHTRPRGAVFVPRAQVMSAEDVRRATTRMAHEIAERNRGLQHVVLIGLQTGGVGIAQRLAEGGRVLVGLGTALDVVPGMTPATILHAGPPIAWKRMGEPLRAAVSAGLNREAPNGYLHVHPQIGGIIVVTIDPSANNRAAQKTGFGFRIKQRPIGTIARYVEI